MLANQPQKLLLRGRERALRPFADAGLGFGRWQAGKAVERPECHVAEILAPRLRQRHAEGARAVAAQIRDSRRRSRSPSGNRRHGGRTSASRSAGSAGYSGSRLPPTNSKRRAIGDLDPGLADERPYPGRRICGDVVGTIAAHGPNRMVGIRGPPRARLPARGDEISRDSLSEPPFKASFALAAGRLSHGGGVPAQDLLITAPAYRRRPRIESEHGHGSAIRGHT